MGNVKKLLIELEDLKEEVKARKAYAEYLKMWYQEHDVHGREFTMRPACYEEFLTNEYQMSMLYTVRVDVWSSSHVIQDYTHIIDVKGPIFMSPTELKEYIKLGAPFSIEEYVEPQTDTPDVVNVEIYEFDIELLNQQFVEE